MKTEKNILIAFLLNLSFSIFEIIGGLFTNSIAILSDAVHDLGDSLSIGISYFLEKKSKKKPDNKYTYGYTRYSVLGAIITNTILIIGSIFVIYNAIIRIINPEEIKYNGMIIFAIIGTIVNIIAANATKEGDSLNQKAVNLHMLEDVLGWIVVLIGSIIMKFTDITIIDPILSILVALYILINASKSFKKIFDLFLEKTPEEIKIDDFKKHILNIKEVIDIHHIHIWSIDGTNNFATMHVVTETKDQNKLKKIIREEANEHGITHITIEIEDENTKCEDLECHIKNETKHHHHH
ncbi:MAG: cation diffusion facilitator family transporter [Candidatus Coprovivens sp.]